MRSHALIEQVAADRIVDDVGAAAFRQRLDLVLEFAVGVVDQVVCAGAARDFEFFVGTCRGDDPCAHRLAEFYRRDPDAARGAEHQQRLAGLQVRALFQRVIGRAIRGADAGACSKRHSRRDAPQPLGRDRQALDECADARAAENAVAVRQRSDVCAHCATTPANSPPGENGNGGWLWYLPSIIRHVGEIQRRRANIYQHVVGPDGRRIDLFDRQRFRRAERAAQQRLSSALH